MTKEAGSSRGATRWILVIAVVTAVVTVGWPLVGRGVFHPGDIVRQVAPWQIEATPGFRPENRLLTDIVDAATPNRTEMRRRVLDGSYPLWNPYPAGGTPLGTQPHNGMLSPLHLPYLIFPPSYAPAVAKILQMLVALAFTFLFLRRLGIGRPAALLGGLLFMNSAFLVVWTHFPHAEVAVLIPGLFWSVERAIHRRTMRATLPVAVVLALMLLHGFPAVTAYAGIAVAVYALVRLWSASDAAPRERGGIVVRLGLAVAIGAGLAAVQLLPFATSLNDFDRGYRAQGSESVLPFRSLATAAVPNAFGSPTGEVDYTPRNEVEMQSFVGASTLILLFGALLRRPRTIPRGVRTFLFLGIGAMVVLIYVGGPPLVLFQKVFAPVFEQNAIGRLRSVLGFFVAILAAIGFESLLSRERPGLSKAQRIAYIAVCVAGVAVGIATLAYLVDVARDEKQIRYFVRQLWIPGAAAGATLIALAVGARWRRGGRHPLILIAPLAFAIESVVFAVGFLPKIDRSEFYPVTSTHRFIAAHIGEDRIAAEGPTLWPGTEAFYRFRRVASHAFHPRPWKELLNALRVTGPETQPQLGSDVLTATSPILDRMGAAFWVTRPNVVPYGRRTTLSSGSASLLLETGESVEHPLALRGVRAIAPRILARLPDGARPALINVALLDRHGTVLARGERRFDPGRGAGDFPIPIAEYHGRTPPATIRIALPSGGSPLRIASSGRRPALDVILAGDDGLRLEFAEGAVVYRRLNALPRVRWASRALAVVGGAERVERLASGLERNIVMLHRPTSPASGKSARVRILEDSGDALRVRVEAEGAGFLVVADSIQEGWRATIDGRPATILPADHAVGALRVPAGDHLVSLAYRPRAWRLGYLISALSALVLVLIALVGVVRRRGEPSASET